MRGRRYRSSRTSTVMEEEEEGEAVCSDVVCCVSGTQSTLTAESLTHSHRAASPYVGASPSNSVEYASPAVVDRAY